METRPNAGIPQARDRIQQQYRQPVTGCPVPPSPAPVSQPLRPEKREDNKSMRAIENFKTTFSIKKPTDWIVAIVVIFVGFVVAKKLIVFALSKLF